MNSTLIVRDECQILDNQITQPVRQFRLPDLIIDQNYLFKHPSHIFVFGDNLKRFGKGGAAIFRDMPNTYGFITKKYPSNAPSSFYTPDEYETIFAQELEKLDILITKFPNKVFLISKLGSGLANKYCIFENVIQSPMLTLAERYNNVYLLW